jgi:hypothetical protein
MIDNESCDKGLVDPLLGPSIPAAVSSYR